MRFSPPTGASKPCAARGITTAVTFPDARNLRRPRLGHRSRIGGEAGEMVVASPVGQYISMARRRGGGGGGGFPGSLMGMIAYVRQIYLDADHYKLVKDAYAKNPRGMERPEYDRALEGVLDSKRILLPANRLVEIDRMLRFAAELKQPTILYGGREAYRPEAADLLKKSNAPVLVSMRWPNSGPRTTRSGRMDSMRTWKLATRRRRARAVLQKAGVKFALYSDGLDTAARFSARGEESDRRRPLARRCVARPDAVAGRNLRRGGPPGQHRERQDRQPGRHARARSSTTAPRWK